MTKLLSIKEDPVVNRLLRGRERIANGWARRRFFDEDNDAFCVVGAASFEYVRYAGWHEGSYVQFVRHTVGPDPEVRAAVAALFAELPLHVRYNPRFWFRDTPFLRHTAALIYFNDHVASSDGDVLDLYDRAIEKRLNPRSTTWSLVRSVRDRVGTAVTG